MAKPLKFSGAKIIKDESGKRFIENEEGTFDLLEEIDKFLDVEPINFKLGKARKSGAGNRKPTYKYVCPSCGKKVKSDIENLTIKCMECEVEFEKQD
jgi:hypothetical protein